MSITSYSELQTATANWLARDDLTSRITEFVTLSEAEFNRKLRTRQMEVTQTTTPVTGGYFSLPTDFLTWKNVGWSSNGVSRSLEYIQPAELTYLFPTTPAGVPAFFSILGTTDSVGLLQLMPTDTSPVAFTYYQKITSLSTSNTSNWLLSAHPDVYLAGALTEGYAYTKDYDQAAVWKARRDDLIGQINMLDQKTRGPASIRPLGPTP